MTNPIHLTVRAAGLGFRVATFTVKAVAIPVELSVRVAGAVCHRVHGAEQTSAPSPPVTIVVEETPAPASPKQRRRAVRREPTRGEASRQRATRAKQEEGAAQETDDLPHPGPEIDVAEPWQGYAGMPVPEVVGRLTEADATTRAAVRLYELAHERREGVLHATEG